MSEEPAYGRRLRQQAFWGLVAQAAAVALPGWILAAAGLGAGLGRGWLLGAGLWALPRAAGAAALWSTRGWPVRPTWITKVLFWVGAAACWVPAATAAALLVGWALLALRGDGSALMAVAELDNTLSVLCLGVGALAFGLGFRLGNPGDMHVRR